MWRALPTPSEMQMLSIMCLSGTVSHIAGHALRVKLVSDHSAKFMKRCLVHPQTTLDNLH